MQSTRVCSIIHCEKPVVARGWCTTHWERWRRLGTTDLQEARRKRTVERFWAKVDRRDASGCWEWQAARRNGYGSFSLGGRAGTMVSAHRFSWELSNGQIPTGKVVRHKCDNPPCVNPSHLVIGSHGENMRDMAERERSSKTVLTADEVRNIRALGAAGTSQSAIAGSFGVTKGTVGHILRGDTWRHVA